MTVQIAIFVLLMGASLLEYRRLLALGRGEPSWTWTSAKVSTAWVALLLLLGVGLRFLVGLRGHNFDVESYLIVSDIYRTGNNVYAYTGRYNYAPLWFHVLGFLSWISLKTGDADTALRVFLTLLTALFTLADLAIFFLLRRRISPVAGLLYFLNPISIIISGYHRQFDNLAILLGLIAVLVWERSGKEWGKNRLLALALLGLSLATKHVLILFPLWLAFQETTWRRRALIAALPLAIFFISFLPYLPGDNGGILKNVFGHKASQTATFWKYFATCPTMLANHLAGLEPKTLFLASMAGAAYLFRREPVFRLLATYLCLLLILSSAMELQYLAIPLLFVSCYPNAFFGVYTIFSVYFLSYAKYGLHFEALKAFVPLNIAGAPDFYFVLPLLLGFVVAAWGAPLGALLARRRAGQGLKS
jgi:hypothetical protein